jgi:hypothetical protein
MAASSAILAEIGTQQDVFILVLAESQALSGTIGDALETIEQDLQPNRPGANIALRPRHFARVASCIPSKGSAKQPKQTSARHSHWHAASARKRMSYVRL